MQTKKQTWFVVENGDTLVIGTIHAVTEQQAQRSAELWYGIDREVVVFAA